jgi:phosphoglycolate phosphatase-like HAD superfamily hydrolase
MRPTVLLFDLDGTLVSTGGAGRHAIEAAFLDLFGRADACSHLDFSGMTDRAIARSALSMVGAEATEEAIARLLARYVERLDAALTASRNVKILEGVVELLDKAAARDDVAIGLGTGNIAAGAQKKLAVCGLWERFPFGGFADDSEERAELILAGARRGAERLARPLERCRVVVIGDTPRDVAAAAANRFESLAVASGSHKLERLVESGATVAVPDLRHSRAAAAIFGE